MPSDEKSENTVFQIFKLLRGIHGGFIIFLCSVGLHGDSVRGRGTSQKSFAVWFVHAINVVRASSCAKKGPNFT